MTALSIIDATPLVLAPLDRLGALDSVETFEEWWQARVFDRRSGRAIGSHYVRWSSVRQEPDPRLPIRALLLVGLAGPWCAWLLVAAFLGLGAA